MIVEKIYAYLSEKNQTLDEAVRYEVERMAGAMFKRQFMTKESDPEDNKGKLRMSSAGDCARKLAYSFHGAEKKGKEIDSRAKIIFFMGDLTELMLVNIARLAGCTITATGLNQITLKMELEGLTIEGHPDGITFDSGEAELAEFKSMSSYAFDRLVDTNELEPRYMTQVNLYMERLGLRRTRLVALNKDNGLLHEVVVNYDQEVVDAAKRNLVSVIKSTKEKLPNRAFRPDDQGYLPWQCLYCAYWGHCWDRVTKVVVRGKSKLKVETEE